MNIINENEDSESINNHLKLEKAYKSQKPKFIARMRAVGRTIEEAEDLIHDVFAETAERLPLVSGIINLPAWINSLFTRRLIDVWRHEKVRIKTGETDIAEETLQEIIASTDLDPLDSFVRESLIDALNDALYVLPLEQRKVIESQVFGGLTFREIAEITSESIDTLTARKRYAIHNLSIALKHWIDD